MRVNVDGDLDRLLQLSDEFLRLIGLQQAGHILDADAVGAHFLERLGIVCKVLVVVHRAQRVADAGLHVRAFLAAGADGRLQVARVIQRVENTQDVDAVRNGLLHKVLDRVVGIRTVTQHVLAAEQHLQVRLRALLADRAQTLPRILVEETDAGVERSAAPALERIVADLVHRGQDREHFVERHTGGDQALVRVTQNALGNFDFLRHDRSPHPSQFIVMSVSPTFTTSPLAQLMEAIVPS